MRVLGIKTSSKDNFKDLFSEACEKVQEFNTVEIFKKLRKFHIISRACGMDTKKRNYLIERN